MSCVSLREDETSLGPIYMENLYAQEHVLPPVTMVPRGTEHDALFQDFVVVSLWCQLPFGLTVEPNSISH